LALLASWHSGPLYHAINARTHGPGRDAIDSALLPALWLYATRASAGSASFRRRPTIVRLREEVAERIERLLAARLGAASWASAKGLRPLETHVRRAWR